MRRPSSLKANRFLSLVATMCLRSSSVSETPWLFTAFNSSSTPTQPASPSSNPTRSGSCRRIKLRNLLVLTVSLSVIGNSSELRQDERHVIRQRTRWVSHQFYQALRRGFDGMMSASFDDALRSRIFQQTVSCEKERASLRRMPEGNGPCAAGANERFALLCAGEVRVCTGFRDHPNAGIPHARTEHLLRCYDGESTSRFTCNRVVGDSRVHLAQHLHAKVGIAHQGDILANQYHSHVCRLRSAAEASSAVSDAKHDPRNVVNDKSA